MMSAAITGGCLCGGVRFELTRAAHQAAGYCHCTRCQRRTGTGSSVQARIDGTHLSAAAAASSSCRPGGTPTAASRSASAASCGAHLFSRNPDDPRRDEHPPGAFDADPGVRPSWRTFVAYAAPWEPIPNDSVSRRFAESKPRD